MAPLGGGALCKVDVYVSSVLGASLTETWQFTRAFGEAAFWSRGRGDFAVQKLGSRAAAEIGCERMFSIGNARLFEELTALDDMEHVVRWVLVSHPSTVSPFGQASFLNYTSSIQLREVTMSNQTFAEWRGQFWTEPQYAGHMEAVLQTWYFAGFKGLEACASLLDNVEAMGSKLPYAPDMMNPSYSVPVQPPPSEQVAFKSPTLRPQDCVPVSQGQAMSQYSPDPYESGPGMATPSSQAWQAARAAFGGSQANLNARHSGHRSAASPASQTRAVSQGPPSNASSAESLQRQNFSRRTSDLDPPSNRQEAGSQGGGMYTNPQANIYQPYLNSIQEGFRHPDPRPEPQGSAATSDRHDGSEQALSVGSSLASNHSGTAQNAGHESSRNHRGQRQTGSIDGAPVDRGEQVKQNVPRRKSYQDPDAPEFAELRPVQRPPKASDRKQEAMEKLKLGTGPRPNDRRRQMRKDLTPDWSNMKETSLLDSDHDAQLMHGVAQNMGNHHKQSTERTSLEQEVLQLQERQRRLHADRSSNDKPWVSPFSANPFAASQQPLSDD